MIDDVKIEIPLELTEELDMSYSAKPIEFNDVIFSPKKYNNDEYVIYYQAKVNNLIFRINNDNLTIINSFHKFFKGNNYTDYSLNQIEATYVDVCNAIDVDILNAKIKKIAYGLVIKTNAKKNYDSWLYHKSTKPSLMTKRGKQYGVKFYKTDYNIKGYDKSLESKLNNQVKIDLDLFRFEVEVINMKNLWKRKNPIRIYTVKDLFSYEVVQYLMGDLINKYEEIEKEHIYDYSLLKKEGRSVLSMMKNHPLRSYLRKSENKTYKRYKTKLKLIERLSDEQYHHTTLRLLNDKATQLLNS